MSSHHSRNFPAFISPLSGIGGSLVSVSGLNLPINVTDEMIFVLINGIKVPFFLSPFLLLSGGVSREFDLLSSPTVILQVPSFQPAVVVITVIEKLRAEEKYKKHKQKQVKELGSFLFTIISASTTPTITNISHNSNIVATAGTIVTLTGVGFVQGITVVIGGITAIATFVSSTQITFVVPSTLPVGSYSIIVKNPAAAADADANSGGATVTSTAQNVFTVTPATPTCNLMSYPLRQFAILGGTSVASTGSTTITALSGGSDVGVFPGTTITGFPSGSTNGAIHIADAIAETAHNQAVSLYNNLASFVPRLTLPPDLTSLNLTPGTYRFPDGVFLGGSLTLNGSFSEAAQFVFQITGSFTIGETSTMLLTNGAQACNIFWQVNGSAAIGSGSIFKGNVVASSSVIAGSAAEIDGRLFSLNADVSLTSNNVIIESCTTCP